MSTCGPTSRRKKLLMLKISKSISVYLDCYDWPFECINFGALAQRDIRPYLKQLRIISKIEDDDIIVNEKNLIANRLLQANVLVDDSMSICPRHRSIYGIHWYDVGSLCSHPDHVSKRRSCVSDCRRAKLSMCSRIEGFPIGGR